MKIQHCLAFLILIACAHADQIVQSAPPGHSKFALLEKAKDVYWLVFKLDSTKSKYNLVCSSDKEADPNKILYMGCSDLLGYAKRLHAPQLPDFFVIGSIKEASSAMYNNAGIYISGDWTGSKANPELSAYTFDEAVKIVSEMKK